jgi:heat-inducible transcriptional repressor
MELKRIHQHLLEDMKQVQQDMNDLMQLAIQLGEQALADEERSGDDYIVAGETQLMGYDELSDIERLTRVI